MTFLSNAKNSQLIEPKFLSVECEDSPNFAGFGDGSPCVLGIDEAGRGPVLGPMVYGCAVVRAEDNEALRIMGIDDSKALTPGKRSDLFALMQRKAASNENFLSYSFRVVYPRTISVQMQRRVKQSLNEISHCCAIELIKRALHNKICIKEVFVDLVGNKEEVYQELLKAHFPTLQITVSKKADSIYSIVGAASIVAKVTRDARLAEWIFEEEGFVVPKEGIGSGYPGDPLTKNFIAKRVDPIFGYPSLVRFSWKTAEKVLEKKAIKCEWSVSSTSSEDTSRQVTLEQLWANASYNKQTLKKKFRRHSFFTERGLSNLNKIV